MVRSSLALSLGLCASVLASSALGSFASRPVPGLGSTVVKVSVGLLFPDFTSAMLADSKPAPGAPQLPLEVKTAADGEVSRDGQAQPSTATATEVSGPTSSGETVSLAVQPTEPAIYTDYHQAMREAAESRKMLFIYFYEPRMTAAHRAFESLTLPTLEIQEKLRRYVYLEMPTDATIKVDGQPVELLSHASFAEMLHRPGVAVIDLAHQRAEYYGHVVSTFPFTPGKYYRREAMSIILDLPPGTLTQRTMIYAVRIHPEAPASTRGQFHTVLAAEAMSHAHYQASIQVQGHHSWDSRFQRINSKLPSGVLAQEVVAESWPNENLVEACIDCVDSWRHSPGHWSAVRSRHPLFGYDIKRGRNGIWYATGIFGRGRW